MHQICLRYSGDASLAQHWPGLVENILSNLEDTYNLEGKTTRLTEGRTDRKS